MKAMKTLLMAAMLFPLVWGDAPCETGFGESNPFALDTRIPLTVGENPAQPRGFALYQNYPNPFNPGTIIRFSLPKSGYAELRIYDAGGRLVNRLFAGRLAEGTHEVRWNGRNASGRLVSSGVYFYQLTFGNLRIVKKMQLVK